MKDPADSTSLVYPTMRTLFAIPFMLLAASLVAQNLTVSGKVIDHETKNAMPYASVYIKGKAIGTITNSNGEFDFHIPNEYRNEILVISMLGYSNFESPVWSMISSPTTITIELNASPIVLQEVLIEDSLSGGDILRLALKHIPNNYPSKPFVMDGFYRDVKKVGGTYFSLLEAAVQIYDDGYDDPRNKFKLREGVRLLEVRRSIGYENKFTSYFDQDNLLEDLLLHNSIRYRQIEDGEELYASMRREKNSFYNGHEIYVVIHDQGNFLKFFIDKDNYAIVHMEWIATTSNEILERKKNLISRFAGLRKTIDFKLVDNKMYLNFITITSNVNWYDIQTNELKFETELFQQLLINKVTPNTKERIGSVERMRNYGLQYQDLPYNKEFWDHYNVIKETPLDKKIVDDLEKAGPLDKQFEGKY
ncbi:MAG TPA: carboxypeptidase-like regulatory domain-containing protein [Cyclobacteriaceae bacterium]|nr:carboxypeptidase-like regulatory domain-containing protein [Cyclobacteriaceae bacterium]